MGLFSKSTESPDYRFQKGGVMLPPPLNLMGATIFGFVFESNKDALQGVCDSWFNNPFGLDGKFQPIGEKPVVAILMVEYDPGCKLEGQYEGYVPYKEAMLCFLVHRELDKRDRTGGLNLLEDLVFYRDGGFIPYIFLDNDLPQVNGRETFMIPKAFAKIDISEYSLKNKKAPRTLSLGIPKEAAPLVDISLPAEFSNDILIDWSAEDARNNILKGHSDGSDSADNVIKDLMGKVIEKAQFPFFSMRQFRDITDTNKACYQAIEGFGSKMAGRGFISGGLLPQGGTEYVLEMNDTPRFQMAKHLGLKTGQKAMMGYFLECDFAFQPGNTLMRNV